MIMQNRSGSILYYFTLAMTFIYALLGIVIIVTDALDWLLPGNKKYFLGTFLILYSAYRAFRIIKLNKEGQ